MKPIINKNVINILNHVYLNNKINNLIMKNTIIWIWKEFEKILKKYL